ncbi:MAG TPA: hypothetical protein ENH85_06330 [Candidatus Scalindua sp.]|nr:hypothetical protein [Candidatus Scalindua sp.]
MGNNVISCCHKCKVQVFHYRNEENKTILPFYRKHKKCAKEDINNVQTVMDNNSTDQSWYDVGGYPQDEEIQELCK